MIVPLIMTAVFASTAVSGADNVVVLGPLPMP
jgi:hypothetical protein